MTSTVPVILNPSARNGAVQERVGPLRAAFATHGLDAELVESRSETHATELAAGFAAQGAPVVVSLGGDGMVRAVAAGLVDTDASLGIIAGGRGNDFIGKLGIPKDVAAAAAIVADGKDRTIDVLDLDGRICVGNVSLGMDSTVQHHADNARRIKGHWVYLYGVIRAVAQPQRIDLVLTIDGERSEFRGYSAGFANSGRYGGGLKLSPEAEVDDGLIDVVLLRDVFLPKLGVELAAFNLGKHDRHPDIGFSHAREVRIEAAPGAEPIEIFADGDAVAHTPATVRIRPQSLTVRVPADS
ncbi:MAG TPA: diacylglycerol kinase family protein [Flexivirga sp.]|uniref:diacylglycerol/lipid kinase family protein n=1 Tax=Flexivirga sp. TaxID=1962927 RepID=UPI002BF9FA6E|nr:diacylglycerol kinase family protein [Flexivirga sp.]HWC22804.1 diacylglycerol kinase family protein [Flexivirga sp.]